MKVTILVPIYHEATLIPKALPSLEATLKNIPEIDWEVILVDAGSSDNSVPLARAVAQKYQWKFVQRNLNFPSVGKTISAGIPFATGEYIILLPIDLSLTVPALKSWHQNVKAGASCGGFAKRYIPSSFILAIYVFLQNFIRSKGLRHLVWTNAIYGKTDLLKEMGIPEIGFLEDVTLSDQLRDKRGWSFINEPILVSARRYYPNQTWKRISLNALIMCLFRLRLASPERLKVIYLGKQKGKRILPSSLPST